MFVEFRLESSHQGEVDKLQILLHKADSDVRDQQQLIKSLEQRLRDEKAGLENAVHLRDR